MIKYLKHNMIDKKRWDDCISKSFNASVYAWSWYLDIVHPSWEALVENDYERVMPLTPSRKFCISYMFQPYFVQQLGVYSQSTLSEDDVERFINSVPKKIRIVRYRLSEYNKVNYDSENIIKHRNTELDLIYDYQSLYNNYSKNTKRNLAKAVNYGLTINRDVRAEDIISLFANNKGKDIANWGKKEYLRLLDLIDTAVYHESCFMCGANDIDGNLIAGAVFMCSHDRIVFLFSASDYSHKEKHALTFIIDNVLRDFSETQYIFDFEGSDIDSLARYYKGFGAKEVFYPELRYNNMRGLMRLFIKMLGK